MCLYCEPPEAGSRVVSHKPNVTIGQSIRIYTPDFVYLTFIGYGPYPLLIDNIYTFD